MDVGIIGLPGVGKTSIFNALTGGHAGGAAGGAKPNVGVVHVPDERLKRINELIETQRVVPATIKVTDVGGVGGSGAAAAAKGEGLGGRFLAVIREVDALLEVVRCFESADVPHVDGSVDPVRDVDTLQTELVFGDLETMTKNVEKQRKHARTGDKEAVAAIATIEQVIPGLEKGVPIRAMHLKPEHLKFIRTLGLLSDKRVLYIANVGEDDVAGEGARAEVAGEGEGGGGAGRGRGGGGAGVRDAGGGVGADGGNGAGGDAGGSGDEGAGAGGGVAGGVQAAGVAEFLYGGAGRDPGVDDTGGDDGAAGGGGDSYGF